MKLHENISNLLASIRTGLYAQQLSLQSGGGRPPGVPGPFVTVSREAGAGGRSFANRLAARLNDVDPGDRPWTAWDRELVERVAVEHHIPEALVEELESYHRTAFSAMLAALFPVDAAPDLDEYQLYRRVAQTVRGLARAGRAILVGRGGVYATRDLAAGVHVRLIAPLEKRVEHLALVRNIPEREAAAEVKRLDSERAAFHRRYSGHKTLLPEVFMITLNTASVAEDDLVECVLPLVRRASAQPAGVARASRESAAPAEPPRAEAAAAVPA